MEITVHKVVRTNTGGGPEMTQEEREAYLQSLKSSKERGKQVAAALIDKLAKEQEVQKKTEWRRADRRQRSQGRREKHLA